MYKAVPQDAYQNYNDKMWETAELAEPIFRNRAKETAERLQPIDKSLVIRPPELEVRHALAFQRIYSPELNVV